MSTGLAPGIESSTEPPARDTRGPARRPTRVDATVAVSTGILSTLVSIPASILVARALGPALKGAVALVTLIFGYAIMIVGLGVAVALVHFTGKDQQSRRSWAGAAFGIGSITGLLAATGAVALLLTVYRSRIPTSLLPWALIVLGLAPAYQVTNFLGSVVRGLGRIVEISVVNLLGSVLMAMAAAVVLLAHLGAAGWLAAFALVSVLTFVMTLMVSARAAALPPSPIFNAERDRRIVRYGLRGYAGDLFQGVNYRLDLFLVAVFLPISAVGLYSVGVTLAEFLLVVPNAIGAVLMQRAASTSAATAARTTETITRLTSLVLGGACIVLGLMAGPLIGIAFGGPFRPAASATSFLLPGIWSLGLYKNLMNDLGGRGHFGSKTVSAAVGAVATLVLDLVLIPRFGIRGAAAASTCAYACTLLVGAVQYRKYVGSPIRTLVLPTRADLALVRALVGEVLSRAVRRSA
jgi:O-antigen/teichoic acid export membrane protein